MQFTKGHGTENDFVILPDPSVELDLTPERVARLCDRRAGIGGDGVLRVATAGALMSAGVLAELPEGVRAGDWFMDYRNADGSVAEMCGNGVRVFAHYLVANALVSESSFPVGSRAGARPVTVHSADGAFAQVSVGMGRVREFGRSTAEHDGQRFDGWAIDVGNPHLACLLADDAAPELAALDLSHGPAFDGELFPAGVNVEFVTATGPGRVQMRVFERGSGETRSCGTGTVAAATAALRARGETTGELVVGVLGGEVTVRIEAGGATLTGPSVLVASGSIDEQWWQAGGRV